MTDSGQANQQEFGGGAGGDVARLLNQARTSLKARDYEAAKLGFRGVYDFLSRRGLGEGLEAMECLADLGATHMALKEYETALSEYARLATIMERNLGEANAELRQHLRRYAQACDVAGRVNEAKQLYSRANDLERRYGAAPSRNSGGGLSGRFQSGARDALQDPGVESEAGAAAGAGGSTFAEAIQDAVARSMAKLDNRGRPFDAEQLKPQPPTKPSPYIPPPLPPSPFQNLAFGNNKNSAQSQSQTGLQAQMAPQGFTGSPAQPDQSGSGSGQGAAGPPAGSMGSGVHNSPFVGGKAASRSMQNLPAQSPPQAGGVPPGSQGSGISQSGSFWRGPSIPPDDEFRERPDFDDSGTASSGVHGGEAQDFSAGNFAEERAQSESQSGDYQSLEQSLDKVFGQNPDYAEGEVSGEQSANRNTGDLHSQSASEIQQGDAEMGYMSGEGNFPVRRKTNPNLSSSRLRQMQNLDDVSMAPEAQPGGTEREPGGRRISAEWQLEPPEDLPLTSAEPAEAFYGHDVHSDSDSSKAMAQWMVPLDEQPEAEYPPIRQDEIDRRQVRDPVAEDAPEGAPKPFDRRQKPKSMKNLRSRFGKMEPSTDVSDAEFEESEAASAPASASSGKGDFAPSDQVSNLRPQDDMSPPPAIDTPADLSYPMNYQPAAGASPANRPRERRLADNSRTNMTPPEMPPSEMLTRPPDGPPSGTGRGPRGLLERSGDYASGDERGEEGQSGDEKSSSMISRLVSKRQHDTSIQNAKPVITGEESQVAPRIRAMVDAARANSADGKFADAARLLQKVVNELAEGGLKDSRYIADCMLLLSEANEASGQLGPAITSFHQHAMMVEKRVGVNDYESIGNWYRLAVLLDKANEREDARSMYEHALGLAEQHLEQDDELTASIRQSFDDFINAPERPRKPAPVETYSTQEVLAQNKELRTASLQQQEPPRNNKLIIWSTVSVIALIAFLVWLFILMGSMNKSIGNIDATATGGFIPEQLFANTDGDGILRFTGTDQCELTVDGKLHQMRYVQLRNDLTDLLAMFANASAKESHWVSKTAGGMTVDGASKFFEKNAPELAMASEMRRIGKRVEEYYQNNRSYPRFKQDWSEDPAFGYLNPITSRGAASTFHVFPRSATPAALFGGASTPDEIVAYLEQGNGWIGEPALKPCTISCAVKHSGERTNGKPVVQEFYMHATDQNNAFLPATKPKTVSVVVLNSGRNIGNFDLNPQDVSKMELLPSPDSVAFVNMSDTPLFTNDLLKNVVNMTLIGVAAIFFFVLLITVATLKSKKAKRN